MAVNLNQPGSINKYKPGQSSFSQQPGSAPKAGTGFTNLQNYLQASKNVGANIGQQAVQPTAQRVSQQTAQAKEQFQQQIAPEEQRYAGAQETVGQALQDPTKFTQDQANVDRFAQYRRGDVSYDPNQVAQQQQAFQQSADVSNLKQMGQLAQSGEGRFQLLRQAVGSPQYTAGQQKLDQLILSSAPEARALKQQVQPVAQQLVGQAGSTSEEMKQRLAGLESARQSVAQDIAQKLGTEEDQTGALGEFVKDITGRVEEENKARISLTNEIKDYLTRGKEWSDLSEEAKKLLTGQAPLEEGVQQKTMKELTEPQIHRIAAEAKDLPIIQAMLSKFITQGKDVTKEQLTSAEDLAKYEALNKLAGKEGSFVTKENIDKAEKIGDRVGLDLKGLDKQEKTEMLSELETPMHQWTTEWDIANGYRYGHKEGKDLINHIYKADPGFKDYMQKKFGMSPQDVQAGFEMATGPIGLMFSDAPLVKNLLNVARSVGGVGNPNAIQDLLPNLAINYMYNYKYLPKFQQVASRYGADPNADFHNFAMNMRQGGTAASTEEATHQLWK